VPILGATVLTNLAEEPTRLVLGASVAIDGAICTRVVPPKSFKNDGSCVNTEHVMRWCLPEARPRRSLVTPVLTYQRVVAERQEHPASSGGPVRLNWLQPSGYPNRISSDYNSWFGQDWTSGTDEQPRAK